MLAILSKLDLHNSSIQRLIKWFDRKVINFNLKNQILIIGSEQFFRSMITTAYGLKIDKRTIETYLAVLREFHHCCFNIFERFLIFSGVPLRVYRYLLWAYCFLLWFSYGTVFFSLDFYGRPLTTHFHILVDQYLCPLLFSNLKTALSFWQLLPFHSLFAKFFTLELCF